MVCRRNTGCIKFIELIYVEEALGWWEPRIEVTEIDPQPDPEDTSRLLINIKYRVRATNDARNLVYPFYLLGRA